MVVGFGLLISRNTLGVPGVAGETQWKFEGSWSHIFDLSHRSGTPKQSQASPEPFPTLGAAVADMVKKILSHKYHVQLFSDIIFNNSHSSTRSGEADNEHRAKYSVGDAATLSNFQVFQFPSHPCPRELGEGKSPGAGSGISSRLCFKPRRGFRSRAVALPSES